MLPEKSYSDGNKRSKVSTNGHNRLTSKDKEKKKSSKSLGTSQQSNHSINNNNTKEKVDNKVEFNKSEPELPVEAKGLIKSVDSKSRNNRELNEDGKQSVGSTPDEKGRSRKSRGKVNHFQSPEKNNNLRGNNSEIGAGEIVELNVGGKIFTTTRQTLCKYQNSMMSNIMNGIEIVPMDNAGRYFVDRDPDAFYVVLNFLRSGKIVIPSHIPVTSFWEEWTYYGLEDIDNQFVTSVKKNIADQFRSINDSSARSSFDKLWPTLVNAIEDILRYEPTYACEIEWGPRGSLHNTVHSIKVLYDANWVIAGNYIKIEISWDEDKRLRRNSCVETWCRFVNEYGFRAFPVDGAKLRFTW